MVALLEDESVFVELVADGIHLHPAVLRGAARCAGVDRALLVTDAMAAAGAPDGDYLLGRLEVEVRDGAARLASTGSIAGSTLTLDAAVRHTVQVVGLSLLEASRAASGIPARMLGLEGTGALQPGYAADLVVLDAQLRVQRVMRGGRWLTDHDV